MFKKAMKWIGLTGLVALLLVAALAVNVIWFKPVTLNLYFERTFLQFGLNSPQALSAIGILDGLPVKFYPDKLDEVSVARTEEMKAWFEDSLDTLQRYDRDDYDGQEGLSYDIFEWFLAAQVDGQRWTWHSFPVNQMTGIHTGLPDFMLQIPPARNERDMDFYLARLVQFPDAFGGTVDVLYEREQRGVVAPRLAIEKSLAARTPTRAGRRSSRPSRPSSKRSIVVLMNGSMPMGILEGVIDDGTATARRDCNGSLRSFPGPAAAHAPTMMQRVAVRSR